MVASNPRIKTTRERAAPDPLGKLREDLCSLLAQMGDALVILDALRDAFLLPTLGVLRDEQRDRLNSEGAIDPAAGALSTDSRALLEGDPLDDLEREERIEESRSANHTNALERIRRLGRKARTAGQAAEDCPYVESRGGYRQAWLDGWVEAGKPIAPARLPGGGA